MNDEDKRKIKVGVAVAAFAVLLYLGIQNLDVVLKIAGLGLRLLSPFLYGVCFAFVLNIPMCFFENKVFRRLNQKNGKSWKKMRRPVCAAITVLLFLGIVSAIVSFVIPQLVASATSLGNNINGYLVTLEDWANRFLAGFGISADIYTTITNFVAEFSDTILKFISDSAPKILGTAMDVTSGVINVFLGFVLGIYMLAAKERLTVNCRRLVYAYLPNRAADFTRHIYHIVNARFAGFVAGQLTEACILGLLCFLGMNLFGWGQYALLISVIIGLTNIVPIIGPILGTIPGALILLISVSPMQALLFVIFIVILQQIESNLIYPRVVGSSIGLPGLWVMFAVLVGGSLFGLPGVLLGVPAFAVLYTLLSESVARRLKFKKIKG